jgi:hypothetical protein
MSLIDPYKSKLRIIRNPGDAEEKIRDYEKGLVQKDQIMFNHTVDIKYGDNIEVIDSKISSSYDEPFFVHDVEVLSNPINSRESYKIAKIMPLSKWKRQQEESRLSNQQINVTGNVGSLAGRDIGSITNLSINAPILLRALEKAIEESDEISREEKKTLLEQIRGLADNEFIRSISKEAIIAAIKSQLPS